MNILLFGISNVGKSSTGKVLANNLGFNFYDLDDEVPDRVCSMIYATCGHGATLIDGEGSFAHKNKKIVYSIVSAADTRKIIPKIREIDPNAFINTIRTEEVMGNFYMRPRD